MQNSDELIQRFTEENRWLKERLDIALNTIVLLQEEIQHLKDEIATLKGQKPRPKIPPSTLEGAKSKDKQNDKNKLSRGKHPRRKKTAQLEIHARNRIKPESIPVGAVFVQRQLGLLVRDNYLCWPAKIIDAKQFSRDVRNSRSKISFFDPTIPYTNSKDGNYSMAHM